ncbi:FAD-dependent oxidoreductase [Acidisoma cellulosilytica]|uniref:FAD-dependent oxidoreductase n=1 Tax=Acidisoma cellulosilyticum TaxID=2802395 RepID=A0A964E6H6_9PROT|nr:FAD-dependent oxidoreductase [Acidisoma cellulosilyticum]
MRVDVAIVGGGFASMWTAIALLDRRPTLRIAILDAYCYGYGASSCNVGKVDGYRSSLELLSHQLGDSDALYAARLGDRSQDLVRNFCTASGWDCQ